ncbi:MAG: acetolactate synthase [Nitrospinae bacterium]|nr:acetolactate synthase [Nitrospinota bacterium]|tara:strand:+ start:7247 stop:8923 length:1677 start_codon:yes stop_codon:yes gene_type:complete
MPKMTGAQYLAEALKAYEVTHLFHVPAILRKTMVELEERTLINRVRSHGEKSAAYMADGYARATGKPGICAAQVIGAMNLAAGLRDAFLARSPVIAFTGGRVPETKFRKVYQEIDDVPTFDPVTKFNATIDDVSRIPDMLNQAFRSATSGSPGPVHLQFAGNEGQLDQQEAEMTLQVDKNCIKMPPHRPMADLASITEAAKILANSSKPVLVVGGGARSSEASNEILTLAEKLNIPVVTSLNGKDVFPSTHRLCAGVVGTYSRESANKTVLESDLVFFIGTQAGGMTTHFWAVPPIGKSAIQLDIDPEALGRNYPLKVALNGDVKATLQKLVDVCDSSSANKREKWVNTVETIVKEYYDTYSGLMNSEDIPMRPERICKEMTDHLPSDAMVVVDTGHSGMWMGGMYDLRESTQNYMRSAGHLGWAFPAALGAKCGIPDRPVICFTGDSGLWYHIGDIETAVRWNINAVILVNNNHSGNQSKRGFDRIYGGEQTEKAFELWGLSKVNFAEIAENMGALGIRVEKPGELKSAFDQAFSAKRPVVLDVVSEINALAPLAHS